MALPEFSRDCNYCCEAHTPEILSASDALLVAQELPFALQAAREALKETSSLGFNTARDLARERYLSHKRERGNALGNALQDPFSSRPLNTELSDLLVSQDPLFAEACEFLRQLLAKPIENLAVRERYFAWWTMRVGAEHYTQACRSAGFSNPRCQAVWRATRHIWQNSVWRQSNK